MNKSPKLFPPTLWNIGWRSLLRRPWQTALMVLGITLGVAVVVAVDLANASASRAFDLSTETVAGKTTHQIVGGPQGLNEDLYARLRTAGLTQVAAPVLTEWVVSPRLGEAPIQLLGIDPFAEGPFRSYLGSRPSGSNNPRPAPLTADLTTFLTRPGAILIAKNLAAENNLQAGMPITIEVSGQVKEVFIAGLLESSDTLSSAALDSLILTDISTAQELTGRLGRIDRIDLILPAGNTTAETIQAWLPSDVRLQTVEARTGTVEQMTSAFRINLTALSLLALVVGMFLIYNTMTFSVVQRRPMFGVLRCLGVTRREVFGLVLSEAGLAGLLGAILGIGLGVFMGQGAVRMVTQTINDLFFVVSVRGVQIPIGSLIRGGVLGIAATLLTAAPPAWEAASVPPRAALSRSGLETKAQKAVALAAILGAVLMGSGLLLLAIPTRSLIVSFGGTFGIIVGLAMLAPLFTRWFMQLIGPPMGKLWGTLGRMAPRDVVNSLSRTSVAVSALMVAISVTIGVSLMVGSFRYTVITWLGETLQGDIYISAPGLSSSPSTAIQPQIVAMLQNWPGIARADLLRSVEVDSPDGPIHVTALNSDAVGQERIFLRQEIPTEQIWNSMQKGGVLVSEPLANRLGLPVQGARLTLETPEGSKEFTVLGVYYDYASTAGTVVMDLAVYREEWQDDTITAIGIRAGPELNLEETIHAMESRFAPIQRLVIRPNRVLREEVLIVFDRTFAITGALQLLATIVAFIGVLSALLSLELERQRELGILRAVGMTVRQVWKLILLETGLLGAVAGLLAMPTGYVLALILVYIINRRSFGWTLQMQIIPEPFLQAFLVAVLAALLAGLYPAHRMSTLAASEAMRSE